ncbi:2-C-methyl-D-erythritol 4-phosphate cytidylyltransferase [Ereboglobus sp. PH5-5]|uniref:2-C-methyl-D-erythritol 4-phosphate cytidylyltransferase n=1 Tax=unclassified Ereboglobus TaxID=2626932 RepID=UPI00240527D4|nr:MULTISPECIES: 2-C-methyl-D-erythritol 4-phosphate cytidylyltransferase [unclassified Ereboglobus]MDF9826391.1 2-C-methyl-D-erythritol 4-phosphate cytidylyltransferase [Ereboglobus sp. PH5-10]MDF9832989.1 2-C-methyl-D-erythritol 4-phosphate cytidylyltransferase [Ereboglobus sp. PH5-5]
MSRTAAILLAAGSSKRMQGAVTDKVLVPLGGRPLFAHSVAAFMESGVADLYIVTTRDQRQLTALSAYAPTPAIFVRGGRTRQASVAAALEALPADIEHVFIHDCARPFVRPEQLVGLLKIVRREHAVVLAHRVSDTIKQHSGEGRLKTIDRSNLWAMETPQVFSRELITRAYTRIIDRGLEITDDAAAVELLGQPVALLENPHPNPKLTTPADLSYFEFINNSIERIAEENALWSKSAGPSN